MSGNRDDHPAGHASDQVPGGGRSAGFDAHAPVTQFTVGLPTGRSALLTVPIDLTEGEALAICGAAVEIFTQLLAQRQQRSPLARLVLPS